MLMRTWALQRPGALLEWENEWRRGLAARRQHRQLKIHYGAPRSIQTDQLDLPWTVSDEPIGAYFQQLGHLHTVSGINTGNLI